jgi:hypothetical protein
VKKTPTGKLVETSKLSGEFAWYALCLREAELNLGGNDMKSFVIAGTVVTLASAASYASWFTTSMSEASVLLIWGGALLMMARGVGARQPQPAPQIIVKRANPDVRSTGAIRLQPGV